MEPFRYSAAHALTQMRSGELSAEAYVASCLERIESRDRDIHAWAAIDPELALRQARLRDRDHRGGPLHGIPVGFKDVIDTVDLPTQYNSPIYQGHRPAWDAAIVALTKKAGGIVMGKTATTEFAYRHPGPACNPHNVRHTPGGSSSGSAAATADFMVPIALGTQTGGSTIRPASYCGVVGFKPSFNLINRAGLKFVAESLDHLGVLARAVEDVALFVHAVSGIAMPAFAQAPSQRPRIGFCRQPDWDQAERSTQEILEGAARTLALKGATLSELTLGPPFDAAREDHAVIIDFEAARALEFEYQQHRDKLSPPLLASIEAGWRYSRDQYDAAMTRAVGYRTLLASTLREYDFLLTPSAPGEAPEGLASTGNSMFNRLWTLFGVPCVTLPAATGPKGLPVGVQVVGPYGADTRTLYWADWVHRALA
ncbi:MAG: amidase [Burkholderiales bacterium]|nr:amidase [Burkholderiales bacterium]